MLQHFNSRLSKWFFVSGTLCFLLLGAAIFTEEILPHVIDLIKENKRDKIYAIKISRYNMYKNGWYNPSLPVTKLPRFEEQEMMTIAQAVPDTAFTAIWTNNADSLVYLRHERFANLYTTNPPAAIETYDNMELPGNVLDKPFTLQILEKGKPVAVFGPVQFLKIISANDDKLNLPLTSTDGKVQLQMEIEVEKNK